MSHKVEFSQVASEDLERLFDFPLQRELNRELVIPFGNTGYVALFEIIDDNTVIIGAIRHPREDDYH